MLKRIVSVIITTLMCFTLFGCGNEALDAQIIYPIDSDPEFLDPQIISDVGAKNIIANSFEGLVTIDEEGHIAPGCAERWDISTDGLTYTFYLRKDCKWRVSSYAGELIGEDYESSFDASVTASDFVFGLKRALRPETRSPGAKNLYSIKNATAVHNGTADESTLGVTATGDHVLVINLEWADPDFLYTLLEPSCMPCDEAFFNITGGKYGLGIEYLLYNGPYYISNWADDIAITLRRNEVYHSTDTVIPWSVYFSINNEQATRPEKIKNGTYHVAPLTPDQATEFSQSRKYPLEKFRSSVFSLIFNCEDEYLSNMSVRRAIVSALDTDAVFSSLGERTAKGILPSSMIISGSAYREKTPQLEYFSYEDPNTLFKKGLTEASLEDAEITILCLDDHESLVRSVMQSWQAELGASFNIFVEPLSEDELQQRISDKEYQLALCTVPYSSVTAFNGLLRFTTDNAYNICNFRDVNYDNLVNAIKTAPGNTATTEATLKAEKYLMSASVIVPLYEKEVYYGLGENVSGVIFNPTGEILYFKNTYAE